MHVAVISIGKSKGIRLSKTVLKKYSITDSVEMTLERDRIIIKPTSAPRSGWDKAFKRMHDQGDDGLLVPYVFNDEDSI